jgi:hypothetical protein
VGESAPPLALAPACASGPPPPRDVGNSSTNFLSLKFIVLKHIHNLIYFDFFINYRLYFNLFKF